MLSDEAIDAVPVTVELAKGMVGAEEEADVEVEETTGTPEISKPGPGSGVIASWP